MPVIRSLIYNLSCSRTSWEWMQKVWLGHLLRLFQEELGQKQNLTKSLLRHNNCFLPSNSRTFRTLPPLAMDLKQVSQAQGQDNIENMWKPRWFPNWRAWHPHPLQNPGTMWDYWLSHQVQRRFVGVPILWLARIPPQVKKVLLTNDLTEPVLSEALEEKVDMVVSYHPPLFRPLKRLTKGNWKERVRWDPVQRNFYSESCRLQYAVLRKRLQFSRHTPHGTQSMAGSTTGYLNLMAQARLEDVATSKSW